MNAMLNDHSDLVGEMAKEASALGIEIADVAGHLEDVSARMARKAEIFVDLEGAAETMARDSRRITEAAGVARAVVRQAREEMDGSRARLQHALVDIRALARA